MIFLGTIFIVQKLSSLPINRLFFLNFGESDWKIQQDVIVLNSFQLVIWAWFLNNLTTIDKFSLKLNPKKINLNKANKRQWSFDLIWEVFFCEMSLFLSNVKNQNY